MALIVIVFIVFQKRDKKYWIKTNSALGMLDDNYRLLLVGNMDSTVVKVSLRGGVGYRKGKKEIALAIEEGGITIFDCVKGFDENNNFKTKIKINKNDIKKITFSRDEFNKKFFSLGITVKESINELTGKPQKAFSFLVVPYDKEICYAQIKPALDSLVPTVKVPNESDDAEVEALVAPHDPSLL